VLALGLAACDAAALPASDGCRAAEQQPLQEGSHLLGGALPPVPYSSVPPTSGWHNGGVGPAPGTYGEPLSEPDLVLWLEKGGIAVAYTPGLADTQIRALATLPSQIESVVVTPYETAMPTPIALVGWGWLQRCQTVTAAEVQAFAEAYAGIDRKSTRTDPSALDGLG
jgi:hypothetical protein